VQALNLKEYVSRHALKLWSKSNGNFLLGVFISVFVENEDFSHTLVFVVCPVKKSQEFKLGELAGHNP
jgi:hypothetical protein